MINFLGKGSNRVRSALENSELPLAKRKSWLQGRRIFGRGMKLFPSFGGGTKILRATFMGYKTILLERF